MSREKWVQVPGSFKTPEEALKAAEEYRRQMSEPKEKVFLVMEEGPNVLHLPFSERYRAFADPREAVEHATERGFDPMLLNLAPGVRNNTAMGDVDITVIALEVQPKKKPAPERTEDPRKGD